MKKSSLILAGALALSAVVASAVPAAASVTPEWTATGTAGDVVGAYGRGDLDFDANGDIALTIAVTDTATDSHGARLYIRFGLATGGSSSPYSVSASGSGAYQERVISYPRINVSNGDDAVQVKECLTEAGGDYSCGSWDNAIWL
ncbi:hypothetical protein Ssi03_77510 [Sphaerisporangium siamense]|uniref:Secreted protein n=1 Tax=Sphaerisporangium siamense TaxID=795645 RepID=A0A7W7DDC4_9ACTN|nr:hypothetical protein [Sphaerisporangium siamense]MBB4704744.1 hypothetical protein [Sphaerisporangium siamense]GII89761.1 hypothetical protein Ssi03_77510 [Sphaerisporangium siamense]